MSQSDRRGDTEGGFSLVEVVFAMLILALGLMSLGVSMTLAYKLGRASEERRRATEWAVSQMERIHAMTVAEMSADISDGGYLVDDASSGTDAGLKRILTGVAIDRDGDNTNDDTATQGFFIRYYHPTDPTTPGSYTASDLADGLLLGLNQPRDAAEPAVGQVRFDYPDGTTGVFDDGFFVTVSVVWNGVNGDQEMKLTTFVTRK